MLLQSNEVLDYLYERYPQFEGINREIFQALLDYYPYRIIISNDGEKIVGVAMFLMLSDDNLLEVVTNYRNLLTEDNMLRYLNDEGNHLHFLGVAADNKNVVLKELHKILMDKKPETYSWYNQDKRLFFKEMRKWRL